MYDAPLPVPVEPVTHESGYGYILRLATGNSMGLNELLSLISVKNLGQIGPAQAQALAALGDAPPDSLHGRFPLKLGRGAGVGLMGHVLPYLGMLRWRRPQVCPACIAANGWCRLEWEFSLSVVCTEHGLVLTDECPTCGARLSWNRPSIEWGSCKHHLGVRSSSIRSAPEQLLRFQQRVNALLDSRPRTDTHATVPELWPLSLGGCYTWAYAFGLCERPTGSIDRGAYVSIPRSKEAIDLLLRALDRWEMFDSDSSLAMRSLRAVVAEPALLSMITMSTDAADREAGMDLYRALFGQKALDALVRRHGLGRQLTLFP